MKLVLGIIAVVCGIALALSSLFGFQPDVPIVAGVGIIAAAGCALS